MSSYDGKTCAVSFSIQPETTSPGALVWTSLGMMKTKSLKSTWDMADSTADSTLNAGKTAIATRLGTSFTGDGVSYDDAIYNQKVLKNQYYNPGATTQNQPKAWFKLVFGSGETFIGPYQMTSWTDDQPEADVGTWSIEATINGRVAYTPN
jgi:hypothetical protein